MIRPVRSSRSSGGVILRFFFADEPTGALDSRSATQLLEQLVGLNEMFGTTIMMVTHDIYAASYCKRVIFLRDGGIVNEIYAGDQIQKAFYDRILETQSLMGGKSR